MLVGSAKKPSPNSINAVIAATVDKLAIARRGNGILF
jgi:hypothetical protein